MIFRVNLLSSLLLVVALIGACSAFQSSPAFRTTTVGSSVAPLAAGFGGGGSGGSSSSSKKKKKSSKKSGGDAPVSLKPKAQWDRFDSDALKNAPSVDVGVRLSSSDEEEWLRVGRVKSTGDDGEHTVYAVLRQRGLIAEHAKRLYPLRIKSNDKVEWGYASGGDGDGEWVAVSPKEAESVAVPEGAEKAVAFEGICDVATGFYCRYHEGKLVNESLTAATSKKV